MFGDRTDGIPSGYPKVAGQVATVVGRDATGGVHIALGVEGVLTLAPSTLRVVA